MILKNLSDSVILQNTKNLVIQEKKLTANIIDHLQIIEQRKLYCDLKYKSLFDYAVKELLYSEDQAYRRISAVRLHLSLSKLTMDKITELQGMYAHKKCDLADIVDLMASALLEKK